MQPSITAWPVHRGSDGRAIALLRFQLLKPFLEDDVPLTELALSAGVSVRTARRWVQRYRQEGLSGLGHRQRHDGATRRKANSMEKIIEGFALKKRRLSAAAIHRKVVTIANKLHQVAPSYSSVYRVIQRLAPALVMLVHEGTRAYNEEFDLLHRSEAEAANAVWQADHTLLDIWIMDEKRQPKKPWLTIVLDDFSRAVAGYFLSFSAPSAMQTALALRQAIWRKAQTGWHICGIPQILYTDHGSDFTSQHMEQGLAD